MDSSPSQQSALTPDPPPPTGSLHASSQLPPEAIALASRFFNAARSGQMDIFEQGLPAGMPPNLTNDKGDSLLMLAAYHGHASLVSLLLRHGADPNRINDRGQSPLAGVVFKNEEECIRVLLEGGADPEVGTPTALDATRVFKQEQYEAMFKEQIEKLKAARTRAVNGSGFGAGAGAGAS